MGSVALSGKLTMALVALLLLTTMAPASGQEVDCRATGKNLSLDVYLYNTGNALVAGYANSIDGLTFLKPARYTPNNTTQYTSKYAFDHQLYAWTDALTMKHGEDWSLVFSCLGFYDNYRVIFHLPGNLRLGKINSSEGLKYMVSTSNNSLIVDAQAYYVKDPYVTIEYQQSLKELPPGQISSGSSQSNNLLMIVAFISILAIGSAFAFMIMKRKKKMPPCERGMPGPGAELPDASIMKPIEAARPMGETTPSEASQFVDISESDAELGGMPLAGTQLEDKKKEIQVSSEIKAIMDTLTPRERSILETLINHGGRMTQTEMRYETGAPKSTLTMVLISLEKRNLVTRREWGRTNVIELSERLFFESEHS